MSNITRKNPRTILVCIDSYDDLLLQGTVWHPLISECHTFSNFIQLLFLVENILDRLGLPKADDRSHPSFIMPKENVIEVIENRLDFRAKKGKLATFKLDVLFRQNSSWQGSLTWIEGQQEETFSSGFDFVLLLNNALQQSHDFSIFINSDTVNTTSA